MQLETFSKDGVNGYKIIGATFASSKNHNGAYFDPVEVFADEINENFNLAHQDYKTDYSSGTTITKAPEAKLEGKLLRFTWDLETTNENFINLIEKEEFGGFSPELEPTSSPVLGKEIGKNKNGQPIYERFYSQNLKWKSTAILTKDQKAGFVGAKDFALEKFEAFEDVVIEKVEEPTPKEIIKENFDATVLEARIEKLETELNQIKENFSKKETEKEDFSNDDLIDQKARLEADIAKLTAEKTKTENFTTLSQNSQAVKLSKNGSVVTKTDEIKKRNTINQIIPN